MRNTLPSLPEIGMLLGLAAAPSCTPPSSDLSKVESYITGVEAEINSKIHIAHAEAGINSQIQDALKHCDKPGIRCLDSDGKEISGETKDTAACVEATGPGGGDWAYRVAKGSFAGTLNLEKTTGVGKTCEEVFRE